MNGSYSQQAVVTLEYQQGRNSAELNVVCGYDCKIQNPYDSASKEWLDWQLGYEGWVQDKDDEQARLLQLENQQMIIRMMSTNPLEYYSCF